MTHSGGGTGKWLLGICSLGNVRTSARWGAEGEGDPLNSYEINEIQGVQLGTSNAFILGSTEVVAMRCVVHVRKSFDFTGQHFVLRLFPLYASDSEEQRLVETFTNEESLSRRLKALGLPKAYVAATFSNLSGDSDAMWTNVEVAQGEFEHFGKVTERRSDDWPQVAA